MSRRQFVRYPAHKREIKKEFNEAKQLFERQILEEDVVNEIMQFLPLCGFRVLRIKERIPASEKKNEITGKWEYNWRGGWKGRSSPGIPDLQGWIPAVKIGGDHSIAGSTNGFVINGSIKRFPIHFYIEVKRPFGSRRRPAQERFIQEAREDGAIAFFAKSWEDVRAGFAEYGIKLPEFKQ
jgi:hypothetical protein